MNKKAITKNRDDVDAELLASLQAKPKVAKQDKTPPAPIKSVAKPTNQVRSTLKLTEDDPITRATVSMRHSENMLADEILSILSEQGKRGTFSDAVKIALRLCPKNQGAIIEAFYAGRAGDRRGKIYHNIHKV